MSIKSTGRLKKEALINLKGNWGIAILVSFIAMLLADSILFSNKIRDLSTVISDPYYYIENFKSATVDNATTTMLFWVGVLVRLLIGGSVTYGLYNFFLNLLRRNNPKVENVFSGFKYFGKNFLIQLEMYIFTFLWSVVVYIPALIILIIVIMSGMGEFSTSYMLNIGSSILITLMTIILIIAVYVLIYIIVARYEMAFFIANDNPDLDSMECLNASKEMMDGNCVKYFLLNLSFIGWHILSILTLGLGYLWLRPYKYAVKANFYMNLKNEDWSNEDAVFKGEENIQIEDQFKEI